MANNIEPIAHRRTRYWTIISIFVSSMVLVLIGWTLRNQTPDVGEMGMQSQASNPSIHKLSVSNLPNAIQMHPKVISGGQPHGDDGFRELEQLGVKTIISVDGAHPDLERATKYGMRYVHMPHGYDGIPNRRIEELAKAVRDLEGPVYIHCHHGKHRSPAAAAAACITAGFIESDVSTSILKLAGTSENYVGLFASVASAKKLDAHQLNAIKTEYPAVAKLPPMAEAMVLLEHSHDRLKQFAANGWNSASKFQGFDSAHEALLLTEHFTEMLRLPIVAEQPSRFVEILRESESLSKKLDDSLRAWNHIGNPVPVPIGIVESFERISKNCVDCHRAYRDLPPTKIKER